MMTDYSIVYAPEGDIATVHFRQKFVADTVLPAILDLKRYPRHSETVGVLWDLREADLSHLTAATLRDIFKSKNAVEPNKPLRIACLVSTEIDTHILRLWAEGFDDEVPSARRWFLDQEEAMNWLRQGRTATG